MNRAHAIHNVIIVSILLQTRCIQLKSMCISLIDRMTLTTITWIEFVSVFFYILFIIVGFGVCFTKPTKKTDDLNSRLLVCIWNVTNMWINSRMDIKTSFVIGFVIACSSLFCVQASTGDRSQFFKNCMKGCIFNNCTEGNGFR